MLKRNVTVVAALAAAYLFSPAVFAKAEIPADAKAMENPVEADDDVLKAAKKLYKKKCKKCHGSKGNGKGPGAKDMDPMPPDWTGGIDRTDGELFWITMHGSEGTEMKPWMAGKAKKGKELTDEQVWGLVHYIRSLVQ